MPLVAIRDADPTKDLNLVVHSFITSHAAFTKADGSVVRYAHHPAVVLDLISRCNVAIACDPDDTDQAYGWICWERVNGSLVVHYVYVKHLFRNAGVARALWSHVNPNSEQAVVTHAGFLLPQLRQRYALTFDPFLLKETT